MSEMQEFDLLQSKLEGRNLIEASAGTGKTFTIAALYLRLLLEKELDVEDILVVTFTEAATNELKDRIRRKLQAARASFMAGCSEDDFLNRYLKQAFKLGRPIPRLDQAIRDFDEAAIFTIHGFCSKVLQENAFESRGLFDTELVSDQNELLRQVVEDFWRKELYGQSGPFVSFVHSRVQPDHLFKLIEKRVGMPYLEIIPKVKPVDCSEQEANVAQSFETIRRLWQDSRDEVGKVLNSYAGLNRQQYSKANIPVWINALDAYLSADMAEPVVFEDFQRFTSSGVSQGTKGGYRVPTHKFFEACEAHNRNLRQLLQSYEQNLMAFKIRLFEYAREELKRCKQERNIQFFDDLLLNVQAALDEDGGDLAQTIRGRYKAALIDEFQDTDPVQYDIFRKIFENDENILFLIGDPKQAIYGFRGADVFAYMQAKNEIPNQYTLSTNWRSAPKLIAATNAIFSNSPKPFIYEEIPFQKARPPESSEHALLQIEGEVEKPFKLWFTEAGSRRKDGRALNKPEAEQHISRAVAAEVVRLVSLGRQGKATLDGKPIEERHIAILVRRNAEARYMQAELARHNIHAVLYSSASLFESAEAQELQRVLAAVAEPKRLRLLKSALATQIFGVNGEDLMQFVERDETLEIWFEKFSLYHRQWQEQGFIQMFKFMLNQEQLLTRLISLQDGERRITNLLHLAEVLHQVSVDYKLGMNGLRKWLAEQISARTVPIEAHQLRLESDENAVKLVTMHMSKGLEYPVVFCPFTWSGSIVQTRDSLAFHDENNQRKFTLDLGSEDLQANKIFAQKEELAENLRLLYVAITRAKQRCYLVWGRFSQGSSSAPAYLFHPPAAQQGQDIVATLSNSVKNLDDSQLLTAAKKMSAASDDSIDLAKLPDSEPDRIAKYEAEKEELRCRKFSGKIDSSARMASFSSLASALPHGAELADYDLFETPAKITEMVEDDFTDFGTFPRGARTGIFVHSIFQNVDFTWGESEELNTFLQNKLRDFGYEEVWLPAVSKMVRNVILAPLTVANETFSLTQIPTDERLNELEFYFPLKKISPKTLLEIFSQDAVVEQIPEKIDHLTFAPFRGFMKGFIDAIFRFNDRYYIIDWKSNHLGNSVHDYNINAMNGAMLDNFYFLQYHIYTLALNQYLQVRLPNYDYERHFGGVFYIFIRGVDPAKGTEFGIYRDRPSQDVIAEMAEQLLARES